MLKAVPKEEKEAIPGINTFNADQVMAGLAESLLRMEGLKKAYARKQEQADSIQTLQKSLNEAHTKIHNLQAEKENAEAEVKKASNSLKLLNLTRKENSSLLTENVRLKEAASASQNFQTTLVAEQSRLIEENEQDCANRMQLAWSLLYSETEYAVWELPYIYADLAIDDQESN